MNNANHERGSVGLLVVVIALLIVGILALRSYNGINSSVQLAPDQKPESAQSVVDKFKVEAQKIEELQKRNLPSENPEESQ